MSYRPWQSFSFILLLATSTFANAEVISIGKQSPNFDRSQLPQHGLSMAKVISRYGEPLEKSAPVGTPPITKWEYDQYTVYFEYEHVLKAVVQATEQATPSKAPLSTEVQTAPSAEADNPITETKLPIEENTTVPSTAY